jgi:YVTN family beta-propeller protein
MRQRWRRNIPNFGTNNVSVIGIGTVPVGLSPFAVAVNPSGTRAYVTSGNSSFVSIIDTANNTVMGTVDVGGTQFAVAVNPSGTRVYVTNSGRSNVTVIDTSTNAVTASISVGGLASGIAINAMGTRPT